MADVDRIADVETGYVDDDFVGDQVGVADQFELVANDVENATALQARRCFFVGEDDGNFNMDRCVL